jgi:protein-disulfide isomerase-like protein with CxxC motif
MVGVADPVGAQLDQRSQGSQSLVGDDLAARLGVIDSDRPEQFLGTGCKARSRSSSCIGRQSIDAATATLAAGEQERGWQFIELFFRNQGEENSDYVTGPFLTEVAEAAGVPDIGRWNEERKSGSLREETEASTEGADELGFEGAPSFSIRGPGTDGNEELLGTGVSVAELNEAINKAAG